LTRFGSQDAAGALGEGDLAAWLKILPHRGKAAGPEQLLARLRAAPAGATGAEGAARAVVTSALVTTLVAVTAQIRALEAEIAAQLGAHPDAHVFTSLPRAGTLRAARLLAETGDCRSRFPDPESLQGLAGVAPVTRQSGKHSSAGFRWAVNKQLRGAVCDFAGDSRLASPWAAGIYDDARARGKDHPHAVRITDGATPMASIDWETAIAALNAGNLPASSGERSVLQLAASIAAGTPVALRDTITSLDSANLKLLPTPSATQQGIGQANPAPHRLRPRPQAGASTASTREHETTS
jgi:hypothetical protein